MRRPQPLPDELPAVFTVALARSAGVGMGRLRGRDLRSPFVGIRASGSLPDTVAERALEYAPRLRSAQFFSHETALALIGAPMPEWPYVPRIHVSAHRPAREPRTAGVVGHRLQDRDSATFLSAQGLRVENPVRAWRQAGTLWRLDDLIAAGDFLVSGDQPWATASDLRDEVRLMGDVRGGVLRTALRAVRTGVRSARETRLRLLLWRAGLPEPEVGWNLHDTEGRFVAELDLAYPRYRVGPEYDGRVHSEDSAQFARDADRWDAIRACGWNHVRILNHHMRGSGAIAVTKVREALLAAGWRPSK